MGTLAFTIVLGAAVELLCFRPLRTLATGAAGLLARRAAHAAGGRDADLRHGLPAGPVGAAARHRARSPASRSRPTASG